MVEGSDIDNAIKAARLAKVAQQVKLLERQVSGAITIDEHERALDEQKKELLQMFGEKISSLAQFLSESGIITQKKQVKCNNAIREWLEDLARQ